VLILRPAAVDDLDDIVALARELDSVNLPADPDFLRKRIEVSVASFGSKIDDRRQGIYVFALEDLETRRCIGTAMILAKTGTPEAPYYWLEVSTEERRSPELDRRFLHTKLRVRSTDDGPTEVGGLILDPSYRRHPEKCGKALSVVRFAYISMHPERFESFVIAEMLSRFEAPGTNLLWEAFGARFTGLSYREADRLSASTKQFIADLFPKDPVYATLFPADVQHVIGRPNDTALAAVRILEAIGFHPLNQVDPFDGGPYYGAARDAIASVRERRELVLPGRPRIAAPEAGSHALLSAAGRFGFRATVVMLDSDRAPVVGDACREALGVSEGDRVSVIPLP
jgi:arginine N-succinyltransferase